MVVLIRYHLQFEETHDQACLGYDQCYYVSLSDKKDSIKSLAIKPGCQCWRAAGVL